MAGMQHPSEPCCHRCHYFRVIDAVSGLCHRYPPVFAGDSSPRESHHWRHPTVGTHSWCGEFRVVPADRMEAGDLSL